MKESLTTTEIGLSIAYTFILLLLFALIDLGFVWLLNNAVFDLLNWFNHLSIVWKLLIIVVGGGSLLIAAFFLLSTLANLLGYVIFRHFPTNTFTQTIGTIIGLANTVFLVIKLWQVPTHFNFWIVIELLILSMIAWSFASIVRTKKEYENIN